MIAATAVARAANAANTTAHNAPLKTLPMALAAVRRPLLRPKNELLPCLLVCVCVGGAFFVSFTLLSTAIRGRLKMTDTKGTTG